MSKPKRHSLENTKRYSLSYSKYKDDTDEEPIYDFGELPELVIKRSTDPMWKLKQTSGATGTIRQYLNNIYDTWGDVKPMFNRLYNLYKTAGSPTMHNHNHFFKKEDGSDRAYINNTGMYVNNLEDIFAELSHPLQEKYGNNNNILEHIKAFGTYNADRDPRGGTRYQYPDRYEGETHYDFKPLIKDYVLYGGITNKPIYPDTDIEDYDFISPKNVKELLDSAVSYNKQRQHLYNVRGKLNY